MNEEPTVHLPQYTPPNPQGLQMAHPKQLSPLTKLMRMMIKPKVRTRLPRQQHKKRWKRQQRYY